MGQCKNHEECMKEVYKKIDTKLDRMWFTILITVLVIVIGGFFTHLSSGLKSYAQESALNYKESNTVLQKVQLTVNTIAVEQRYMKQDIEEIKK